jgi:hypothetical protein
MRLDCGFGSKVKDLIAVGVAQKDEPSCSATLKSYVARSDLTREDGEFSSPCYFNNTVEG